MNWIYSYYQDIKDGSVAVGAWVRKIYERIVSDLANKHYFYDQKKANQKVKPKAYPDGFWGDADCPEYDYFDVDAWMPLPMPWEGGAE